MTVSGVTETTYGSVVQEIIEVEDIVNYSLEELVSMPCTDFVQRGYLTTLNTALTTAVTSMTAFTESK